MTSIISVPSKHLQAVFNVKVSTYLPPPPGVRDSWPLPLLEGITMSSLSLKASSGSSRSHKAIRPISLGPCFNEPQSSCVSASPQICLHSWNINICAKRKRGRLSFLLCLPFNLWSDLAGWSPWGWSDSRRRHCVREVTLIVLDAVALPPPRPPRLCNSSEAERASLKGAVHLDTRPISQESHWSARQMAWFPRVIIGLVLTPSLMCKRDERSRTNGLWRTVQSTVYTVRCINM